MQYTENLDGIVLHSIGQNERGAANDQLGGSTNATFPASVSMVGEKFSSLPNAFNHISGHISGCFRIIFGNKIQGLFKIG